MYFKYFRNILQIERTPISLTYYPWVHNLNVPNLKYTLLSCSLRENAISWWDVVCNKINSWEDFDTFFKERFRSDFKEAGIV